MSRLTWKTGVAGGLTGYTAEWAPTQMAFVVAHIPEEGGWFASYSLFADSEDDSQLLGDAHPTLEAAQQACEQFIDRLPASTPGTPSLFFPSFKHVVRPRHEHPRKATQYILINHFKVGHRHVTMCLHPGEAPTKVGGVVTPPKSCRITVFWSSQPTGLTPPEREQYAAGRATVVQEIEKMLGCSFTIFDA